MHIGLLANTFEPVFGENAGGHVHFLEVARRWTGARVTIFAPEMAREAFGRALPDARFVAMPSFAGLAKGHRLDFLLRALAGIRMRDELRACDVVLCTSHFLADTVPAIAAAPDRTAVIVWHVIEAPWRRRSGAWLNNTLAYLAERASLLLMRLFLRTYIVGSAWLARSLALNGSGKHVFVTTNGVDLAPESGVAPDISANDALYVGRVHPQKGVEDLIRAWALLPPDCAGSRLFLAGSVSPEYRAKLEQLAGTLGLAPGRVLLLGRIDEAAKASLLRHAGLFAFASAEEGWGIALAEAMAAGLPCVTYNLPVFEEIFRQGRVGVAAGDIPALAGACAALLTDDELRARCSAEAKELARSFTWERAAQVEMSALQSLLKK